MSARVSHRPGLRALLLGAALVAGAVGGGVRSAAAEESCFAKSAMDHMPDWVQARGEFFRRYAMTVRRAEHFARIAAEPALLAQNACMCPGELVSWEDTSALIPDAMRSADFRELAAEERRIGKTYADFRNTVVIPTCSKQKAGGN